MMVEARPKTATCLSFSISSSGALSVHMRRQAFSSALMSAATIMYSSPLKLAANATPMPAIAAVTVRCS